MNRSRVLIVFGALFFILFWINKPVYSAGVSSDLSDIVNQVATNGQVYSVQKINNSVYIGGNFTEIGRKDEQPVVRTNIAEYNTETNTFTDWNPVVNGTVYSVAANYNTIYIAGEFTEVNSQPRKYVASFNRQDKSFTSWSLDTDGPVRALALDGNDLYLGGTFTVVNDQSRKYLTIYDIKNNRLADWWAEINGGVEAIIVDPLTVYIGGEFTEVNGQTRNYLAAFDKSTGQLTAWAPAVEQPIHSLVVQDSKMYIFPQAQLGGDYISSVDLQETSPAEIVTLTPTATPLASADNTVVTGVGGGPGSVVNGGTVDLGFKVPNFSEILTFLLRGFFVIAGLAALFYLLLGAFNWITSGGDKDAVAAARDKIQSAIIGLIMVVVVLTIVVTLEQFVFSQQICLGLSCPATIPVLIEPI